MWIAHDRMISQRGIWDHKTSLTLPLFIELSVPSQESEHVVIYIHVCVKGVDSASLSFCSDWVVFFLSLLSFCIDNPNVNGSCFKLFHDDLNK